MMTRAEAAKMNKELQDAVKAIFEKHGMTIDRSNLTYGDYEIKLAVKATPKTAGGAKVVSPAVKAKAAMMVAMFNPNFKNVSDLSERLFNDPVMIENLGSGFVVDYNSKCSKYPFVVEVHGTKYKCSRSSIIKFAKVD